MSARCMGRLVLAGLASLLITAAAAAQGKQEPPKEESVAAAARRAQAQKRPRAKPAREYTNDNLPVAGRVAVIGDESAYAPADETPRPAPSAEDEKGRSATESLLKAEQAKLEALKKELDIAERQLKLDTAQLYTNPQTAASNTGAQAQLAGQQQEIATKKAAIAESEARITELTEKARALNDRLGPRDEGPKTPEQVRDSWGAKLRPLRDELARVESELSGMRSAGGSAGLTGFAAERAQILEQRRAELQRQIGAVEDDARRAGSLPPQ